MISAATINPESLVKVNGIEASLAMAEAEGWPGLRRYGLFLCRQQRFNA